MFFFFFYEATALYRVLASFNKYLHCVCVCVSLCVSLCIPVSLSLSVSVSVCVCVCSNANPLHYYTVRVPRKAEDIDMVYFQFTHRLGRPHYVWDEYLYSVGLLEEVEVRMIVCVTVCVV